MSSTPADSAVDERPWPETEDSAPAARADVVRRQAQEPPPEKLPPHSLECEQGVLGCFLHTACSGDDISKMMADHRKVVGQDGFFYDLRHSAIWRGIEKMWRESISMDTVALLEVIKGNGELEASGGLAYLAGLPDLVPSAANIDYYVGVCVDNFARRKSIQTGQLMVEMAYNPTEPIRERLGHVIELIESSVKDCTNDGPVPMRVCAHEGLDELQKYGTTASTIVPSGFRSLDGRIGNGFGGGELWFIAARPSIGKTTLMLNMAGRIAQSRRQEWLKSNDPEDPYAGKRVLIHTYEEKRGSLAMKIVNAHLKFNARQHILDAGGLKPDNNHHLRIVEAFKWCSRLPILIDHRPLDIESLCASIRAQPDVEIVFIDYLQKIRPMDNRANPIEQTTQLTERLRDLALAVDKPVVCLAQMNREIDREKSPRPPRFSDLKGASSVEQDAHGVIGLWQGIDSVDMFAAPGTGSSLSLRLMKNRSGQRELDVILPVDLSAHRFYDPSDHEMKQP